MDVTVKILDGEYWWGGSASETMKEVFPLGKDSVYSANLRVTGNQTMPLFLSSFGRYIYSPDPFTVDVADGEIRCKSLTGAEFFVNEGGETLRDAYLRASEAHFPFTGKVPPLKFFETAQYNTWMEFDYEQNQEGILAYAHAIVENGYEPGILMIDEGWHTRYGLWEFDLVKFPDPKAMVDELHALGFTVMLWVVPNFTADGKEFAILTIPGLSFLEGAAGDRKLFLRTDDGEVALAKWWNGVSALFNMCNEADREYLDRRLRHLMDTYGVDGFKFDGGNICSTYHPGSIVNGSQTKYTPEELNRAWNEFGEKYTFHEYKDTFGGGGKPTIQRLSDRSHRWGRNYGLASVLPAALMQGLIGHPFICPDMVGGGSWAANYTPGFVCDEELFVRMAECSALFPMMQFSWAPWRMLSPEYRGYCLKAARLHKEFAPRILDLVREAAVTGEPILRHMEYEYPHCGYHGIEDQFLLGSDVLVAPVLEKGAATRDVVLPRGTWLYLGREEMEGGRTVTVPAPIDVLPYFVKKEQ